MPRTKKQGIIFGILMSFLPNYASVRYSFSNVSVDEPYCIHYFSNNFGETIDWSAPCNMDWNCNEEFSNGFLLEYVCSSPVCTLDI